MKLVSCALLVSGMLMCASSVMGKTVTIDCIGALKNNCPSGQGYRKEYHGKTAKDSGCFCIRDQTKEEAQAEDVAYQPQECEMNVKACKMYGSKYGRDMTTACDEAFRSCKTKDIEGLCAYLKENNTKRQCSPGDYNKQSFAAKHNQKVDEQNEYEKVCGQFKKKCLADGLHYSFNEKRAAPCEKAVANCPVDEVKKMCKKNSRGVSQYRSCQRGPAYKNRKEVHVTNAINTFGK